MKHLDSGTIHAFLDGELYGSALEEATAHFSLCDACSNAMLEAENETAAVDFAFAAENVFAVPTQRIWARINNEIDSLDVVVEEQTKSAGVWQAVINSIKQTRVGGYAIPTAAFASGLAVVILFSLFSFNRIQNPIIPDDTSIARVETKPDIVSPVINKAPIVESETHEQKAPEKVPSSVASQQTVGKVQVVKANFTREKQRTFNEYREPQPQKVRPAADLNAPLAEERLYLDTIDDLAKSATTSNESNVMRASFRVEYEQNLALMDKAISKMQKQVRSNPNDENAKRLLFASYQNKIDLLNTVAEKSQLTATLR